MRRRRLEPRAGSLAVSISGVEDGAGTADAGPDLLFVGDSVLVLIADELAGRIEGTLHIDGADCRRLDRAVTGPCGGVPSGVDVDSGLDAVRAAVADLAAEGIVPDAIVLVLANNASVGRPDLDAVMEATAGIPHVWWVNTRIEGFGRQDPNNRALAELAAADPRAGVVDWFTASAERDLLADNVHPDEAGQAALAQLIRDRLRCGCTA